MVNIFCSFYSFTIDDLLLNADPDGDILLVLEIENGVEATSFFLDFQYRCFLSHIFFLLQAIHFFSCWHMTDFGSFFSPLSPPCTTFFEKFAMP